MVNGVCQSETYMEQERRSTSARIWNHPHTYVTCAAKFQWMNHSLIFIRAGAEQTFTVPGR
eukprot:2896554-Pyramimonas_sp.AAC.1